MALPSVNIAVCHLVLWFQVYSTITSGQCATTELDRIGLLDTRHGCFCLLTKPSLSSEQLFSNVGCAVQQCHISSFSCGLIGLSKKASESFI